MSALSLSQLPVRVKVCEMGPRDGLQNEAGIVPTSDKIRYIDLLSQSGLALIETTSFVRPSAIPQLTDAEEVDTDLVCQNPLGDHVPDRLRVGHQHAAAVLGHVTESVHPELYDLIHDYSPLVRANVVAPTTTLLATPLRLGLFLGEIPGSFAGARMGAAGLAPLSVLVFAHSSTEKSSVRWARRRRRPEMSDAPFGVARSSGDEDRVGPSGLGL